LGADTEDVIDGRKLSRLIDIGFMALGDISLRASDAGRQRLNAELASLLG
jgi:hypothetical protein